MELEFCTAPRIIFGPGTVGQLADLVPAHGARALLVLGGASAEASGLAARLRRLVPVGAEVRCAREPTVEDVDHAVQAARDGRCDVVVAVGGGSVLDCGKAAAGMLTNGGSLLEYLEGVGSGRQLERPAAPMIAAPTTAGTGSEVTRNAVISGPGYKKSIRSPLLIPRVALVDPVLTHGTPPAVTAACGMDALTQLCEAYISRGASPLTDGLALEGIRAAGRCLERAFKTPEDPVAREGMALAALLGGICLANAGLGAVHGFASPLGALFPIPHGVACAALLPQVLRRNMEAAFGTTAGRERLRERFVKLSEAFTGHRFTDATSCIDAGLSMIQHLQRVLGIPRLRALGVSEADLPRLVAGARGSSMRGNPVELSDEQLEATLRDAL